MCGFALFVLVQLNKLSAINTWSYIMCLGQGSIRGAEIF